MAIRYYNKKFEEIGLNDLAKRCYGIDFDKRVVERYDEKCTTIINFDELENINLVILAEKIINDGDEVYGGMENGIDLY